MGAPQNLDDQSLEADLSSDLALTDQGVGGTGLSHSIPKGKK